MTSELYTTAPDRATPTPQEMFFDRLDAYFDLKHKLPPVAVDKLAADLVQVCAVVRDIFDCVLDQHHRAMIAQIVGDGPNVKEWERGGYALNEGARLLTYTFGFNNGEAA